MGTRTSPKLISRFCSIIVGRFSKADEGFIQTNNLDPPVV